MPRILPVTDETAPEDSRPMLDAIKQKHGRVPNIYATFAHAPAALKMLLSASQALGTTRMPGAMREAVTLAIAGANDCDYCAAAHAALARKFGVGDEEVERNLRGESDDVKTQAAIDFALAIVRREGYADDSDFAAARDAGLDDAAIVELIAVTGFNLLTNYFNHAVETVIDFPQVTMPHAAAN